MEPKKNDEVIKIDQGSHDLLHNALCHNPTWESVRMRLAFPKWGLGSPLGLSKLQSLIAWVKTPHIWVLFISLEKLLKCRCQKWPHMGHLDIYNTSYGKKEGLGVKLLA